MRETVPFDLRALAALCVFVLASPLIMSDVADARDRPGTPNNEKAYRCNDVLRTAPAVCVEFDNTASEPVRFDIEFTVNGTKVDDGRPPAKCTRAGGPRKYQKPLTNCEAATHFNQGSGRGYAVVGRTSIDTDRFGNTVLPQAFRLNDLEYDSTYCFRFKARRVSDQVVSETWSNWVCAQTGGQPPKPSAPQNLVAVYTPGGLDWRTNPPLVVLQWSPGDRSAVEQIVLKESPKTLPSGFFEIKRVEGEVARFVDTPTEAEVDPNGGTATIFYRVCAVNISGKSCSKPASTFRPPLDVKEGSPGVGDVLDQLKPKVPVEVESGQSVGEVIQETTPPTAEDKKGVFEKPNTGIGEFLQEQGNDPPKKSGGGAGDVFRQ